MIAAVSTGPMLERVQPSYARSPSTSLFASASLFESAPWLNDALSQIHDLEKGGKNYPGIGDLTIPPETSATVRILLSQINLPLLPRPSFSSVSGGAIVMKFTAGERDAEFTVFPSGTVIVNLLEGGNLASDDELSPQDQGRVQNAVLWALGRL